MVKKYLSINRSSGFTLIELLVVIAVVGIVSVAILAGINVTGKLNQANLANAKTFAASVENSLAINQVGKWSFEDSASLGKDTSGYGNDGTVAAGVIFQDANTCGLGFGGCASFSGASGVRILFSTNFYGSIKDGFTYAFWIYPTEDRNSMLVGTSNTLVPKFERQSDNKIVLQLQTASTNTITSTTLAKNNQWTFVVGTWNATTQALVLYINSNKEPTANTTGSFLSDANNFVIGGDWDTGFFKGFIDEVAIYSQPLTFSQIQKLYAQGLLKHQLAFR